MHVVGGGELFGDLVAGVATPYDEQRARGDLAGVAVAAAVQLAWLGVEVFGERRSAWGLERACGYDDLVGFVFGRRA